MVEAVEGGGEGGGGGGPDEKGTDGREVGLDERVCLDPAVSGDLFELRRDDTSIHDARRERRVPRRTDLSPSNALEECVRMSESRNEPLEAPALEQALRDREPED